ncbi:MAG TPA: type II toxin-antitoxin system Phd/YefM family antitoxin [Gemmatimonadales bacterium]|jgi:prevent-host-death family protein|nr:type II toxin-antitoxin system Phd/YefM family antitoxin [Gemmatimonadales bacterium]
METVSKSRFKARALDYFRQVQRSGVPIVITDRGVPVLKLIPYRPDPAEGLRPFLDTVVRYGSPLDPAAGKDWDSEA